MYFQKYFLKEGTKKFMRMAIDHAFKVQHNAPNEPPCYLGRLILSILVEGECILYPAEDND